MRSTPPRRGRLDRQAEHEPVRDVVAQCQAKLAGFDLLPAERARGRVIGWTAVEAHRHVLDQEDEMVAVVQHA